MPSSVAFAVERAPAALFLERGIGAITAVSRVLIDLEDLGHEFLCCRLRQLLRSNPDRSRHYSSVSITRRPSTGTSNTNRQVQGTDIVENRAVRKELGHLQTVILGLPLLDTGDIGAGHVRLEQSLAQIPPTSVHGRRSEL